MRNASLSRKGFTLIEILVAVALLSVMLAALYSTFFLSHKAMDRVDESLVRLQECRALVDVLKREIEAAHFDGQRKYTLFKVDDRDHYGKQASRVVFTTSSPLNHGLSKTTYEVVEEGGELLVRKYVSSAYNPSARAEVVDLIEGIESFSVEADHNGRWIRTWDSSRSGSIPGEVRISVTFRPKRDGGEGVPRESEPVFTVSDVARPRIGRAL